MCILPCLYFLKRQFVWARHESAMEEEIQTQGSKFPRIANGNYRTDSTKIGQKADDKYPNNYEGEIKRLWSGCCANNNSINIAAAGGVNRLCGWPSSRIVRVSRASGGKDRHSKVLTSKGLRDRRVRLSVNTAIQFYDLQDRLGYDQPSKAVEWLLKAAATSIDQLPPINNSFPDTPNQLSDEKRSSPGTEHGFDSAEVDPDGEPNVQQHQQLQYVSLSKSTCSSTSETSKGSGLSLSRSENRIKARERARERTAEKEKEKGNESQVAHHPQSVSPITQNSSFTELLTGGINKVNDTSTRPNGSAHQKLSRVEAAAAAAAAAAESNFFQKSPRQWAAPTPVDYLTTGLLVPPASSSKSQQHSSSGFSGQILLGNSFPQSVMVSPFHVAPGEPQHHQEMEQQQNYAFVPDHLVPPVTANGSHDYNLNFTISSSSSLAGFNNRGTLQSNTSSLLPQLQRFYSIEGSGFFIGNAATPNSNAVEAPPVENHRHRYPFPPAFDAHLQLFYGDGGRSSDHKEKGKQ